MKSLQKLIVLSALVFPSLTKAVSVYDSLYSACLKTQKNDTDRIKCLDLKSFEISNSNPMTGLLLAKKALQMAQNSKWLKGIALAHNEMAVNYKMLGEMDSAARNYYYALQYFSRIGNLKAQAGVMTNISQVYQSKGDFVKALDYLNKALRIQENFKSPAAKAITLENIGSVYLDLKEYDKARNHYLRARSVYKALKDSIGIARNLINLGIIYDQKGYYDSAIDNFGQALKINLKTGRLSSVQIAYSNLGIAYTHLKDYEKALDYHEKAMACSKTLNSDYSLALDYGNTGEVYLEKHKLYKRQEDLDKAIGYLKQGYSMCRRMGLAPPQIEFGEKLIEGLALKGNNYQLAFEVFAQKTHLKDSVYSKDNSLRIYKLETERAIARKEHELRISNLKNKLAEKESQKHKQEKTILILVVVILALASGLLYVLYINRRVIFKKRMFEISQIQSHKIRSPLTKIMSLTDAIGQEDTDPDGRDKLLRMLHQSANELDQRIHEIVEKAR